MTINKRSLSSIRHLIVFSLVIGLILPKIIGIQMPAMASVSQKPKLVVFLIADQFPVNILSQSTERLQSNGLRQLLDNGAYFSTCRYMGATNQTACNLESIVSGAYPWATGVIGNEWYDHRKQKSVSPIFLEDKQNAADASGLVNNTNLTFGTTFGDELKLATNGASRIISISTSRVEALLLAGKSKDSSYWWDYRLGKFSGNTRNGKNLPVWVNQFNEKNYSGQFLGKAWTASGHSPFASNTNYDSDNKGQFVLENNIGHTINMPDAANESFHSQFCSTPWANQMLIEFAKEAIDEESLGQQETTDVLNISFPAFESVGKNYGPYSQASYDLIHQFDLSMVDLLQSIDAKVGLTNCLIVFTATHGAMPSPAMMQAQGMESGIIDTKNFREQLNSALSTKLGKSEWIEAFIPPNLYLNLNAIDHSNYRQPDVEKIAAKLARSIPGVAETYTAFQFFMNEIPIGSQVDNVRKSYFLGRSGELYVIPKPGFVFSSDKEGIVGGSPYSYDVQVPLVLYGGQIKAGNYSGIVSPVDIAPTVANILNICAPPLSEGRVLTEAINLSNKVKSVKAGK